MLKVAIQQYDDNNSRGARFSGITSKRHFRAEPEAGAASIEGLENVGEFACTNFPQNNCRSMLQQVEAGELKE